MSDFIPATPAHWANQFRDLPVKANDPLPEHDYLSEHADLAEDIFWILEYVKLFDPHKLPVHWLDHDTVESQTVAELRPDPVPAPEPVRYSAKGWWKP